MGLTCSLLGHTFDETDVEEEHDDRGSEIVTVIREIERCSRCGAERVLSENKEVTSVLDAEDIRTEEPAVEGKQDSERVERATERAESPSSGTDRGDMDRRTEGVANSSFDPPDNPEDEDAEILTDQAGSREPGDWPGDGNGNTQEGDPSSAPDADETDARPTASSEAESVDGRADEGSESDDGIIDAEADLADGDDPAAIGLGSGASSSVPEHGYECPECGFTVESDPSFRAGDACPACQHGHLTERNP